MGTSHRLEAFLSFISKTYKTVNIPFTTAFIALTLLICCVLFSFNLQHFLISDVISFVTCGFLCYAKNFSCLSILIIGGHVCVTLHDERDFADVIKYLARERLA